MSNSSPLLQNLLWLIHPSTVNHGTNDLGQAPAANMGECMTRCAGIDNCVRAIFNEATGICYLRTHGNKDTPVTVDPYDSAHLVEDPVCPCPCPSTSCPNCPTCPTPPVTFPDKCPAAEGQKTTVGGVEYKIYCSLGHSASNPNLGVSSAKDFKECMEQCCKWYPFLYSLAK